ncbi:Mps one binder kinase activator-like 2 [Caenorhabditis elegans]|uniref:Mps one binder kinase activator-like 2 n=2 Tax=Caenorhabditis elegans TaxID=6239 RepID=G5ECT9_CAEEL|nr:Mps one binder kinase activator-like 2 [Caenorhabditis elegans]CAC35811.1 Mps one binder kinase activator-like 2 [Caenorhabditis elegans]|eukprot:NP_510184.1 Mps One Binder (Mats/MOB1) homolog [Caenorhabditis elegans]
MGHPTEKATNISAEDFSSSDPITPPGPHHQQSASEPGRVSSSIATGHQHQKGILNRLPDYFRDTVDWFIGRSRRSKERTATTGTGGAAVASAADRMSKRVASASLAVRPQAKSSDLMCVCDSIDGNTVAKITSLPEGIEKREWIAHNVLGLFEHVNALCGTLSEVCTQQSCPHMSFPGTSKAIYTDERGKRQVYPAVQYIDCVITQCESMSRQEEIFPTKYGNKFNGNFEPAVKKMLSHLFHCMGHMYLKHWDVLGALQLRPQCAIVFAHIAELGRTFSLLDAKDQEQVDECVTEVRPILPVLSQTLSLDDPDHPHDGDRSSRVPSSKSGSWGGYPSPAVLSCKAYAQTC